MATRSRPATIPCSELTGIQGGYRIGYGFTPDAHRSGRFNQPTIRHEVPAWKLRRVVDPLESDNRLDVQRVANYRTVSDGDLGVVATELRRIGWLSRGVAKCS